MKSPQRKEICLELRDGQTPAEVAFWNMVGAGLFGFMINPPIALYYMQGLNTTPLHGHAALFGVYGILGPSFTGIQPVTIKHGEPLVMKYRVWVHEGDSSGVVNAYQAYKDSHHRDTERTEGDH